MKALAAAAIAMSNPGTIDHKESMSREVTTVVSRYETLLIRLNEVAVGAVELIDREGAILTIHVPDGITHGAAQSEYLRSIIKEASRRLSDKSPDGFDESLDEDEAAFNIAAGILCELKDMGLAMDGSRRKRHMRITHEDLSEFTAMCWATYPSAISVPGCIPFTRAEITVAFSETSSEEE